MASMNWVNSRGSLGEALGGGRASGEALVCGRIVIVIVIVLAIAIVIVIVIADARELRASLLRAVHSVRIWKRGRSTRADSHP